MGGEGREEGEGGVGVAGEGEGLEGGAVVVVEEQTVVGKGSRAQEGVVVIRAEVAVR